MEDKQNTKHSLRPTPPEIHHSYDFLAGILYKLTLRGFQSTVTTGKRVFACHKCRGRAAAFYFYGVRDAATVEMILKFQQIIVDSNPRCDGLHAATM